MEGQDAPARRRRLQPSKYGALLGIPHEYRCASPPSLFMLQNIDAAMQLGRPLDLEAEIPPSMDEYAQFAPSFTLDAPARNMQDQNTEEKLAEVEKVFAGYVAGLGEKYGKVAGNLKDAA